MIDNGMRTARTLKAIIFDFDGVLADSEPLHLRGFQTVLLERGIDLSEQDYTQSYVGLADQECFRAVLLAHKQTVPEHELHDLTRRKSAWMLQAIRSRDMLVAGTADFIKEVRRRYRLAVASCALRAEIVLSLQMAGLLDAFEVIASAEDASIGKPDPAIYLRALERLQQGGSLTSAECLAVEDTPFGIQAAQDAGMKCLAVTTTCPPSLLGKADVVVPSIARCDFPAIVGRLWSDREQQILPANNRPLSRR
jgi:beta-phosphoglucomutase